MKLIDRDSCHNKTYSVLELYTKKHRFLMVKIVVSIEGQSAFPPEVTAFVILEGIQSTIFAHK